MNIECKIDGSIHDSLESLHGWLRKFRIKQADYYLEYYPRYNLYTKELLKYKNYDQYFSQDFEDKNQLKSWIKSEPEKAKSWAIEWLRNRKVEKNIEFAPSQAELRTLLCPSMPYYDSIGGYYEITRELGYKERYKDIDPVYNSLPLDVTITCDTREQNPLNLPIKTVSKKIDCGDYGLNKKYDLGIYVERKSLNDFCGTMSKGNIRFRKLLERAKSKDYYIVMLIESSISDAQSFPYLPQTKRVKASPSFIFKQMRDLLVDYPLNFQVIFVDGRIDAAQKLIKIFQLGEQVKSLDLQNALEQGKI